MKVYNEYGSGEIGAIAHECEKGNLHVNSENVYVEISVVCSAPFLL